MALPTILGKLAAGVGGRMLAGFMGSLRVDSDDTGRSALGKITGTSSLLNTQVSASGIPVLRKTNEPYQAVTATSLLQVGEQLDNIAAIVQQINNTLRRQEALLVYQSQQAARAEKERIMELKPVEETSSISALGSLIERLAEKLSLIEPSDSDSGTGHALGGKGKSGKPKKLRKGVKPVETSTGTRYRDAKTGRFVSEVNAIKPSLLSSATSKISSTQVATAFGRQVAKGKNAIAAVTPAAVKKIAMPIAGKALGRTVLKSIPIIGAVAGVGFAVSRLMEGDIVGAGLDAVSGLAGPMSAIPALIASIARDIYTDVYGVHPERDPLVEERMTIVKDGVKQAIEETISPVVQPKQAVTKSPPAAFVPPIKQKTEAKNPESNIQFRPPSPQSKGSSSSTPATTKPSGGTPIAKSGTTSSSPETNTSASPIEPVVPESKPKELMNSTMEAQTMELPRDMEEGSTQTIQKRSMGPTTEQGFTGIGNVPDPTYYRYGSLIEQFYFEAA